jgi:hypothetical protein
MRCQSKRGLPVVFSSGYEPDSLMAQDRAAAPSIIPTKPNCKAELARRLREALTASV